MYKVVGGVRDGIAARLTCADQLKLVSYKFFNLLTNNV